MGHERLGFLPRTVRWKAVIEKFSGDLSPEATIGIANGTLENVRRRFERLADEDSIQAAFSFLLGISIASRSPHPNEVLETRLGITLEGDPTPLALTKAFHSALDGFPKTERADLAAKSLADALVEFSRTSRFKQERIFGVEPWDTWREANTAAGFCDLSRLFFSKLTERYLRYYLDREASASLGEPERLADFRQNLRVSVDQISKHAFETSKIAQSFTAGWFQKNSKGGIPPESAIRGFLSYALNKIREELRREASNQ